MYLRLMLFSMIVLLLSAFTSAQGESCLQSFRAVAPIEPDVHPRPRDQIYGQKMVWFSDSQCLFVATTSGLWLYDTAEPSSPLMLATSGGRAIRNVAVNRADSSVAFNVAEEAIVYLVRTDGTFTTIRADGQAVTSISFSADGRLIAISSSNIGEPGFHYGARVQIWDLEANTEIFRITDVTGVVKEITFSADNTHLLIDGLQEGYGGDDVAYWKIAPPAQEWTYEILFQALHRMSASDPFVVTMATMRGRNVAMGGLYGYHDYNDYSGDAIHIWDAERQERRLQIVVSDDSYINVGHSLTDIDFNSDGSVLASSAADGAIQLWSMTDGSELERYNTQLPQVSQIAFSPDNRFIAVLSGSGILIWDNERMEAYATLDTHQLIGVPTTRQP